MQSLKQQSQEKDNTTYLIRNVRKMKENKTFTKPIAGKNNRERLWCLAGGYRAGDGHTQRHCTSRQAGDEADRGETGNIQHEPAKSKRSQALGFI